MAEIPVKLKILDTSIPHLQQIITGFKLLDKEGVINLTIRKDANNEYGIPSNNILIAEIADKILAYDVLDGYNLNLEDLDFFLEKVDVYYKRSFSAIINSQLKNGYKIKALGLNHNVEYPTLLNYIKKYFYFLANKLVGRGNIISFIDSFTNPIKYKEGKDIKILYMVRLWEPNSKSVDINLSREKINNMRIELCRRLKEIYPNQAVVGLSDSEYARGKAPDLILKRSLTNPANYLSLMKKMDICIATTGLHNSIGWKFAEYVAASKAIISERLEYEVPYGFSEGINYYSFDSVDQCLSIIDFLLDNPDQIYEMKKKNELYYNNFGRADKMIYQSLIKYI